MGPLTLLRLPSSVSCRKWPSACSLCFHLCGSADATQENTGCTSLPPGVLAFFLFLISKEISFFNTSSTINLIYNVWYYSFSAFKKILFNVYLFLKETETVWVGMGQRERERKRATESETVSRLWAASTEPHVGLKLTNREIMTWAEIWCSTDWATQAPLKWIF